MRKTSLTLGLLITLGGALWSGQNLGGLTLVEVAPRIITPNDDLQNDKVFFKFADEDSLVGIPYEGSVYDINGARVSSLNMETDNSLSWDGTYDNGHKALSGIYIYSIKIEKYRATGTVVIAR